MQTIELITPCYNEEACVRPFLEEVKRVFTEAFSDYKFIITYVDDGSKDNTLKEIQEVVKEHADCEIRYISLSRNFGKEAAMYAGLSNCIGDYVCILDVDLQHPITLIPEMLKAIEEEDFDCATARRVSRKGEPVFRSLLSSKFYSVFSRVTGLHLLPGATDFRLMKKNVAKAIASMAETERFTKGIYSWIGFKNKWIEYENVERTNGQTKWNMRGLLRYSLHGFMAFATAPLRAAVWLGLFIVLIAFIWIVWILARFAIYGDAIGNGITTLTLIVLFLGGVIISLLGIIGEYMARIYLETKKRPIYLVRKSNIEDECNRG